MFDIKAKIERDLKNWDAIKEDFKEGKIKDFFFIARYNDEDRPCQFFFECADCDMIQWIGIFEYLKSALINSDTPDF